MGLILSRRPSQSCDAVYEESDEHRWPMSPPRTLIGNAGRAPRPGQEGKEQEGWSSPFDLLHNVGFVGQNRTGHPYSATCVYTPYCSHYSIAQTESIRSGPIERALGDERRTRTAYSIPHQRTQETPP